MAKAKQNNRTWLFIMLATITVLILMQYFDHQTNYINFFSQNIDSRQHTNAYFSRLKFNYTIKPYRNSTVSKVAWQKMHTGNNGKLIIIHARKAGGLTLRGYMSILLNKLKAIHYSDANFTVGKINNEFYTYIHRDRNIIDKRFEEYPFGIFAITLRHPIDRILSQYQFEWRWGCQKCLPGATKYSFMNYDKSILGNGGYFNETFQRYVMKMLNSNIELDELLYEMKEYQNVTKKWFRHKINFNAYINNYYLWMFCCWDKYCNIEKDFVSTGRINECMEHAMRMIMSFDIVLITEWLSDIRTKMYVNRLFFGNDIKLTDAINVPWTRFTQNSYIRRKAIDIMVNNTVYQELVEVNKWDLKFYEFVKQLVFERMKTITNDTTLL